MGNMKKFNKIIFESLIDKSSYSFSNDENGNIFCTFSLNNEYIVHAKVFNDILTFNLTDKNGETSNMSEKEFSFTYQEAYDDFKEKLDSYSQNKNEDSSEENTSKIEDFDEQLVDAESDDPTARLNKDLRLGDKIFNFKILNDLLVENYAQCIFEFYDKKKNEKFGAKCLLFMKKANSIIVKIVLQDDKGQVLKNMTDLDFKLEYPDEYLIFKKAISKFEFYLNQI